MKTKLLLIGILFSINCFAQENVPLVINKDAKPIDETKLRKNAIYFELLGNSIVYSLNYERMVYQKGKTHIAARAGIGHYFSYDGDLNFMINAELNMLLGKMKNFFEVGLGHTADTKLYYGDQYDINWERNSFYSNYITLRLGYRYQRADRGLVFRLGILPMLNYRPGFIENTYWINEFDGTILTPYEGYRHKTQFAFWGGISIGKTF